MKAYVTSIGESTSDLCMWSLERLGFKVELIADKSSLWDKLFKIFHKSQENFLRIDADVVVNRNVLELVKQTDLWWYQSLIYDWFAQDVAHGGIQFIRQPAIEAVRNNLADARNLDRPETYLSRIKELHNPRRFGTFDKICGLHGYKQTDKNRVELTKKRRGQEANYDFELAAKLEEL